MSLLHWFLRASNWARNPPSDRRVALVVAVIGACIVIVLVERLLGWPEALTVDAVGRRRP